MDYYYQHGAHDKDGNAIGLLTRVKAVYDPTTVTDEERAAMTDEERATHDAALATYEAERDAERARAIDDIIVPNL